MSLPGKRHKASKPSAGVGSGLSKCETMDQKKLRGEGDGHIPHTAPKSSVKKQQGNFDIC